MHDKAFLTWLLQRLVLVYREDPDIDFVGKLASIIGRTHSEQMSANVATDAEIRELLDARV